MKILPLASAILPFVLAAPVLSLAQPPPNTQALDRAQTDLQLQQQQRQLNALGQQPGTAVEQQRLNLLKSQNEAPLPSPPTAHNRLDQTLQNEQMQLRLREEQNRINALPPPPMAPHH